MKKTSFLPLLCLVIACGSPAEENDLSKKVDSLEQEIRELKEANDTLSDHLMQKAYVTRDYPQYFDSIAQPEEFLLNELQKQPGLIPKQPVLGGTMRFTSVNFINDDLLMAEYEDGHILGKAVYSYSMNRRGELQFELKTVIK